MDRGQDSKRQNTQQEAKRKPKRHKQNKQQIAKGKRKPDEKAKSKRKDTRV